MLLSTARRMVPIAAGISLYDTYPSLPVLQIIGAIAGGILIFLLIVYISGFIDGFTSDDAEDTDQKNQENSAKGDE